MTKFFSKVFWQTLWQDKKAAVLIIGIPAALLLIYVLYKVVMFKVNRSWNWNMGGYASRTEELVHDHTCKLGKSGAFREGFDYSKYCK